MLNLQEFHAYMHMNLKDVLGEEFQEAMIEMHKVNKNNGKELNTIIVKQKDSNIAPQIYIDGFFQEYQEGADLGDILDKFADAARGAMEASNEVRSVTEDFKNFDSLKNKVIMVVVNTEKNQAMLSEVPHQRREDLSIIYKVLAESNSDGILTVTIRNEHMEYWGITEAELEDLAIQNTNALFPVTVQSMNEVMREMFEAEGMTEEMLDAMFTEGPANEQMYVISNKQRLNGAIAMFDQKALSALANKIGSDLFVLPSSVHECIVISTNMGTPEMLAEMVQEINGSQVDLEDQLSDHVYHYDASTKKLSLADTTMEQLQIKASENIQSYETQNVNVESTRNRHHR